MQQTPCAIVVKFDGSVYDVDVDGPAPFTHNFSQDANPGKSLFQKVPGCNGIANLS